MSNRDVAFVALGRFLVVERYRETCLYPSTNPLPGRARTRSHPDRPDAAGASRTPAQPRRG